MESMAGSRCPLCGAPDRFIKHTKNGTLNECTRCGEEDEKGNMIHSQFSVKLQVENSFE